MGGFYAAGHENRFLIRQGFQANEVGKSVITRIRLFLNKCLISRESWGTDGKGVSGVDKHRIFREMREISVNDSNLGRQYFLLVFKGMLGGTGYFAFLIKCLISRV